LVAKRAASPGEITVILAVPRDFVVLRLDEVCFPQPPTVVGFAASGILPVPSFETSTPVIYLVSLSVRDMTLTAALPKFVLRGNHWLLRARQ
jgi:hypothetical protein